MKFSKIISLFLIVLILTFFLPVMAQRQNHPKEIASNCEAIGGALDGAASKYTDLQNPKAKLIIIAGSRSLSYRSFDLRRVSQAMHYLASFHAIKDDQVDWGIGMPEGSLSYLRLYVAGDLIAEIKTIPKGRLCRAVNDPL